MFFKNSIKTIYRSLLKSVLMILILTITTFVWEIGVSTWHDIEEFLEECDKLYSTIGRLEYIGTDYPDEYIIDENISDILLSTSFNEVLEDSALLSAEWNHKYFGNVQGYVRDDTEAPVREEVVLVVSGIFFEEQIYELYQGRVKDCLFAHTDLTGYTILINMGTYDFEFERGKDYVIHGVLGEAESMLPCINLTEYEEVGLMESIQPIAELDNGVTVPREYLSMADSLQGKHDGVVIHTTENIEMILPFHQNTLYIEEGRGFTKEEYEQGESVCIMNGITANRLEKKVGDTVTLSWMEQGEEGFWDSYRGETGFDHQEEFTIVGITNKLNSYNYHIYIPKQEGFPDNSQPVGYDLLNLVIDNRESMRYAAKIDNILDDKFRFTIYDQGYQETASAYLDIKQVALMVIVGSGILCLGNIVLLSFLYVYKQKETAQIMLDLSVKPSEVLRYYFYGCMMLGLMGVAMGTVLAINCRSLVLQWIVRLTSEQTGLDLRYSDFNLSMKGKSVTFSPESAKILFVILGLSLLILCMFVTLFFAYGTIFKGAKRKKKNRFKRKEQRKVEFKHNVFGGGMGFAWKGILRGGKRSITVVILGCAITIFSCWILNAFTLSNESLIELQTKQRIKGHFTDYNGRNSFALLLEIEDMENLHEMTKDCNIKMKMVSGSAITSYIYLGVSGRGNEVGLAYDCLKQPESFVEMERITRRFKQAPKIIFTNSIYEAEEFIYTQEDQIKMDFIEGYNESFLNEEYTGILQGMISYDMAMEQQIELGDTIAVAVNYPIFNQINYMEYEIYVVGFFEKDKKENQIYCPMDAVFDTSFLRNNTDTYDGIVDQDILGGISALSLEGEESNVYDVFGGINYSVNRISFQFEGTENISLVKDVFLENGFEQVGTVTNNRKYIVVEDGIVLSNLFSLSQQNRYITVLTYCMIILCCVINILISVLIVYSRKEEIGITRSLGASMIQVFESFLGEQCILYFFGGLIGIVIWWSMGNMFWEHSIGMIAVITACYLIGAALSLILLGKKDIMEIVKGKE
ncbi:ABC transporter permease [Lachnospiraceae bacterium OttesenSCG-928-D06]|nr:ABC transporter permease [Lachnospiraceae bacterium OttesenSCG-928-D06]